MIPDAPDPCGPDPAANIARVSLIQVEDRIEARAGAKLVARLAPEHTSHTWHTVAYESRGWFGGGRNTDGSWEGARMLGAIAEAEAAFGTFFLLYLGIREWPLGEARSDREPVKGGSEAQQ